MRLLVILTITTTVLNFAWQPQAPVIVKCDGATTVAERLTQAHLKHKWSLFNASMALPSEKKVSTKSN